MSKGMYLIIQAIILGLSMLYIAWKLSGTDLYVTIAPVLSASTILVLFTTMGSWKAKSAKQIEEEKAAKQE